MRLPRDSVITRLVVVTVVAGFLTGVLGLFLVRAVETRSVRADAEDANLSRADRVAVLLDGRIGAVRDQLELLAAVPSIAAVDPGAEADLAVALRIAGDLDRLVLYDGAGTPVAAAASSALVDLDELGDWEDEVPAPGGRVRLRGDRRLPAVEIAVRVEDPPGTAVGVLVGETPLSILAQEAEARLRGTSTAAFVVGGDGTIVAHREQDRVLDRERFAPLEALLREQAATLATGEGQMVMAATAVESFDGWVVVEQPESVALAPVQEELGDVTAVFVAVIAAIVAAVVLAGGRMLSPLGPLAEAVHRLERGELATRTGAEGVGEVRVVARGFNRMARALQDRQSELEAAEHEARSSEQRLRLLVEGVEDYAIVLLDLDGGIRSWNSGARRMFNAAEEDAIGAPLSSFSDPDEPPTDPMPQAARTGRGGTEGWFRRADGTRFWGQLVVAALHEQDGTPYGYAAVVHDLTERQAVRRALEEALEREQQAADELRRTNEAKDEFLAIAAHELQTPLAAILGAVSMMGEPEPDAEERDELRAIIEAHAEDMRLVVDRFLDFARLQAGRIRLAPAEVRLDAEIEHHLTLLARPLADHPVEVEADPVTVSIDRAALRHIVTNLVSNAAKFSPRGSPVRVAAEAGDGQLTLTVEDRGVGIGADEREQIFELFRRSGREPSSARGTGVGLAIVRRYVDLLDGTITLDSTPGEGSTFRVSVPVSIGVEDASV